MGASVVPFTGVAAGCPTKRSNPMPSGLGSTSAGSDMACTPRPGRILLTLQAQTCPGADLIPCQLSERNCGLRLPTTLLTLDCHIPLWVPGQVAPAIITHAAAFVDLQVIVRVVVAVEIEQDAHAVVGSHVGVVWPDFDQGDRTGGRVLTAKRHVEILVIECQAHLRFVFAGSVAYCIAQNDRPGSLPTGIVELAVQEWRLRSLRAQDRLLGTGTAPVFEP